MKKKIYRVAIDTPLRTTFDYLANSNMSDSEISPGCRVSIPFGRRDKVTGLVMEISNQSEYPFEKLKTISHQIDDSPVIDKYLLNLILWTSAYYHHPVGEVALNALPAWLRKANLINKLYLPVWRVTTSGMSIDVNTLGRAPKQAKLLMHFQKTKQIDENKLTKLFPGCKTTLKKLFEKKWIEKTTTIENKKISFYQSPYKLNKHQQTAIDHIAKQINEHAVFLLDGLTGSGKTEVYLEAIKLTLEAGKQCLVLLPEIGLTPQLIQRFKARFNCKIAIQHSSLTDTERARHWLAAKDGSANIILGTRSAVWSQMANPGLFIVDEEHDLSYKQQDRLRYSARDVLIYRARQNNVPVILGSATPSLESLNNVKNQRYQHLILPNRAGKASLPNYKLFDMKGKKMHGALSQKLIDEMKNHILNGKQVLLFLNRRGYADQLFCHACAWHASCERCEFPFTYHKQINKLICHHCESQRKNITHCKACNEPLIKVGHGTERIEEQLQQLFPDNKIVRIDRDTTRNKDAFEKLLIDIQKGNAQILIGTQMLAKGHHFPNVTLTAIIDADRGLFSADFRGSERLAQLFTQVSGRSGRGDQAGSVFVQTYYPQHLVFQQLIQYGYATYAMQLLEERKIAGLPPIQYMAILNAESHQAEQCKNFLSKAKSLLNEITEKHIGIFGPLPAIIEKKAGRYRWQLVIQAKSRKTLHMSIDEWIMQLEKFRVSKKIRWSLDIDPLDMA